MTRVAFALVALVSIVGCGGPPPSSAAPTPSADRASIQIDKTWTAANGQWTFTGLVDPFGDATDVVLEIGPGTARQFDTKLPVAQGLTAAGPLTITTREIPDIDQICVRFTATNSAGSTSSTPLCFPHDIPSFAPGAPTVQIDERWTAADGEWTFKAYVDPKGEPTDVILEIGPGPATAPRFDTRIPAARAMTEAATLAITTKKVPDSDEVCVRFTATNSVGTSSSTPLCVPRVAASPSENAP